MACLRRPLRDALLGLTQQLVVVHGLARWDAVTLHVDVFVPDRRTAARRVLLGRTLPVNTVIWDMFTSWIGDIPILSVLAGAGPP